MCAGTHQSAGLLQMEVHGVGVGVWQHQTRSDTARRADRPENVRPMVALVSRRRRTASALCPDVGQTALLTDPGLILPPEFDRLITGLGWDRRCNEIGEVFL